MPSKYTLEIEEKTIDIDFHYNTVKDKCIITKLCIPTIFRYVIFNTTSV